MRNRLGLLMVVLTILIHSNFLGISFAENCNEPYPCTATCYRRTHYKKSCGFMGWDRCRHSRSISYTCTSTCYKDVCCEGYTGEDCESPLCNGSTSCPNEGRCVSPDNCQCAIGFEEPQCADINECSTSNGGCEHTCVNTHGSYHCECRTGYLLASDTTSCIEINECNDKNGGCEHKCTNTPGSFQCRCNLGYNINPDNETCNDVDECSMGTSDCAQLCNNTVGSYTCSCTKGYMMALDGYECEDVDECAENTAGCTMYCNNTIGSFTCSCRPGYALAADEKTCNEIDECSTNNGNCDQICENIPGSYKCECLSGYNIQADKHTCVDIDECSSGLSDCDQICINTPGSFNCNCNVGYQTNSDGKTCENINDCVGVECQNGGSCIDGIANYTCQCSPSFTGMHCESDFNECAFLNGGCEDTCTNKFGSYICSCSGNGTLNTDRRSCTGDSAKRDVFERHKIARRLLPRGCFEIVLTTCKDGKDLSIYLTSTSPWYKLRSNQQIIYTYGIVFADVNSLAVPVSIPGVEVKMADGTFDIKLGASSYGTNAGEVFGIVRTEDCWNFDVTSKDVFDFIESSSFLKSYFYALIESLPDWIKLQPTNDTVLDVQGLKTELTYGRDVDNYEWCKGAPVLDDHLYSLFLFDTSFSLAIYENAVEIPKPIGQENFCLVVDLCHNHGGTIFLLIPKESRRGFGDVDVFKKLNEMSNIKILPRGIGLSVVREIDVQGQQQTMTLWNGDHVFSYDVMDRANLWINSDLSMNYQIQDGLRLEAYGAAEILISVPKLERVLTAMFVDEWNMLFSLRATVTPIIEFELFGENYKLEFQNLVDIKTNAYMSIGGQTPRLWCGENSNPPGVFMSTVVRINPFKDIPILGDWIFENAHTLYAFFMIEPSSQINDGFTVDIKENILQIDRRVQKFKQIIISVADTFGHVLNNFTMEIVSNIKRKLNRIEMLSERNSDTNNSFMNTIDIVTNIWELYSEIDKSIDDIFDEVEFLIDVSTDNFSVLLENERNHIQASVKAAVQKLRDQLSLAATRNKGFGLKYTTSIKVFGFKFFGLDIEFVYSIDEIGKCSRFEKVYKLLDGERAARFLGTFSRYQKLGPFLTADVGRGIGGAFGIDSMKVILQVTAYVNMLGISITGDVLINERGLYFFMEGNLWNIFLVQVDVSAERADDWYKLLFKLEGQFVAKTRKRRQTQTVSTSFQSSYLDALKKAVTMISDEADTRITQAKEALESAKKGLSKAQGWLDEKKEDLRKANSAFDDAIENLEAAKGVFEKAKRSFDNALEELNTAQRNVDNLCRIKKCRKICIPGIKCGTCQKKLGFFQISYTCCSFTNCMISFPDPICFGKNLICEGIRQLAYAALEAAKIFVKVPMTAFYAAKDILSMAQFIVDKSRVAVDLAEGVLDLANLGLEGAKGVLDVAKGSLEAVKVVVGAAARVLEFVTEYGVKNVIDVRNCGFSVELSTTDLPVFDVSCEVNAFKLGWKKIRMRINFKNAFQTIWQAAKATIKSIMKSFGRVLSKRSIDEISYKTAANMQKLLRHLRDVGPENLNETDFENFLNETIDVLSETVGFNLTTADDYDNRVLLFKDKCTRIRNVLDFFNTTFGVLHEIVTESVTTFEEIDELKLVLDDMNSTNIAENMTLEDAEISEEYAMNDYNISRDELEQAFMDAKNSFMNDPMLLEISKTAEFSKNILESELKSVESVNIISQWILAMENVTSYYFDETECVDVRDCIFHSVTILYDIYTAESLPNLDITQRTISDIEDNILELFQNTSGDARSIYNTSARISNNIKSLTSTNLFCSEAPAFRYNLENVTVIQGQVAKLTCSVTADPEPVYWWYKDNMILHVQATDTLVIMNVSKTDEGVYYCMAGNVVANISSNDAHLIVEDQGWEKTEEDKIDQAWERTEEEKVDLKLILGVTLSVLAGVSLIMLAVLYVVHKKRRCSVGISNELKDYDAETSMDHDNHSTHPQTMQYENKLCDHVTLQSDKPGTQLTLSDIEIELGVTKRDFYGV